MKFAKLTWWRVVGAINYLIVIIFQLVAVLNSCFSRSSAGGFQGESLTDRFCELYSGDPDRTLIVISFWFAANMLFFLSMATRELNQEKRTTTLTK